MIFNRFIAPFGRIALLLAAVLGVSACAAGESLSRLNPFSGGDAEDPDAPDRGERISIMAFEDRLQTGGAANQPATLPTAYVNDRWPQSEGYASHAMQHLQLSGPLERLWRVDIGEGSSRSHRLNARPVGQEGRIFTLDAQGRITARDADTGAELWRTRLGRPRPGDEFSFGGALALEGGRLFAHSGFDYVVALDAQTGEELWRQTALTPFHSAPTAADGRVYVSTDDNELIAMDAETGDVLWTHRGIAETARLITAPAPAVLGDVVVAPYSSGEIVALRAQNGSLLWSDSLTRAGGLTPMSTINDIAGSPVIFDNQVYAMSHSGVMGAFDLRTGAPIWSQPAGGLHAPWVAGEFLFIVTTEAEVAAIERRTGSVRWITELEAFENARRRRDRIAWAGPIVAGGRALVFSSTGEIVALDARTGEILETRDLGREVYVAPIVMNETVYVLSDDGALTALR